MRNLARVAARIGVADSRRFLKWNAGLVGELAPDVQAALTAVGDVVGWEA